VLLYNTVAESPRATPGVALLVATTAGAYAFTLLVVAGTANAVNLIDGFNGLASMCVVIMMAAVAYVAFQAGDTVVLSLALAGIGATLGFFIWNFPAGLIFLGDGGAYFLGFWFAELSILLLVRNPGEVSHCSPCWCASTPSSKPCSQPTAAACCGAKVRAARTACTCIR